MDTAALESLWLDREQKRARAVGLDAEAKDLRAEVEQIDRQILDQMAEAGVESVKTAKVTVSVSSTYWVSAAEGRKDALNAALKDSPFADLVQETVHSARLRSLYLESLKTGEALPESILQHLKITPDYKPVGRVRA
jgi:hypothetical protein